MALSWSDCAAIPEVFLIAVFMNGADNGGANNLCNLQDVVIKLPKRLTAPHAPEKPFSMSGAGAACSSCHHDGDHAYFGLFAHYTFHAVWVMS